MASEGKFTYHQYQVVGRHLPTEKDASPALYRMKLWAEDPVRAKSKFWYFLRKLRRVKKANGQIVSVSEIFERRPTQVKNYGIWIRYTSRTGVHNMYKEYRDVTLNGAVDQMYAEMGGRHRVRHSALQIIKTATLTAAETKRPAIKQFHDAKISFPSVNRIARPSERVYKTVFKASRPNVSAF